MRANPRPLQPALICGLSPSAGLCSARSGLALALHVSLFVAYALRVSLSITIVAMTNSSHPHGWSGSAPHGSYPGFAQDVSGKQMQITERCFPGSVCSCFCIRTEPEAAEKSLEDQEVKEQPAWFVVLWAVFPGCFSPSGGVCAWKREISV